MEDKGTSLSWMGQYVHYPSWCPGARSQGISSHDIRSVLSKYHSLSIRGVNILSHEFFFFLISQKNIFVFWLNNFSEICSWGPTDKQSALVRVKAWRHTGAMKQLLPRWWSLMSYVLLSHDGLKHEAFKTEKYWWQSMNAYLAELIHIGITFKEVIIQPLDHQIKSKHVYFNLYNAKIISLTHLLLWAIANH